MKSKFYRDVVIVVAIFCLNIIATDASVTDNDLDIGNLKSLIPEGLNTSALPTADDVKNMIKEKCKSVSNNDEAYQTAETAAERFKDCWAGLVDFEEMQREIEDAKPKGDLDEVFHKYCRKRPIAIECLTVFTNAISPCLNENELAGKTTFVRIFTNLLNFVCHKDGDQIALFIAEKGPECFTSKQDALITCVNSTLSGYIPSEMITVNNLPELVLGPKQCNDMHTIRLCIVKELESCEESTPANIIDALFRYIRNETPCANMTYTTKRNT